MDNTTFGSDIPSIPQWTGPPHTIVQVQAILFASLAASLLSAFLAMLGKQWVNRYASVDMRGSTIERSQNRQRKLDGIVSWYFDPVMESLPLMLQVALLLLGFALSRYFWEINKTVASVVVGVTSFGVLFFLFIVVAGAASVYCPYQTPGAQILRRVPAFLRQVLGTISHIEDTLYGIPDALERIPDILRRIPDTAHRTPHILDILLPVFTASVKGSICCGALFRVWDELSEPPYPLVPTFTALLFVLLLPVILIMDVCKATTWLLVASFRRLQRKSEGQTASLDLHCISWTLQTSLDGPVRLSTLNYLAAATVADFDPALVVDCFNILFGCVKVIYDKPVIAQGMEQLAMAASVCCLRTLSHLMTKDPTSRILGDSRRRYARVFPFSTDLNDLPFSHTLHLIHTVSYPDVHSLSRWYAQRQVRWEDYKPSNNEHAIVAHALTKIARSEYRKRGREIALGGRMREKVPCWILRFALHSLSRSPLPPAQVVADSLSIIALDLGCDISTTMALGERYVRVRQTSAFLTKGYLVGNWMSSLIG